MLFALTVLFLSSCSKVRQRINQVLKSQVEIAHIDNNEYIVTEINVITKDSVSVTIANVMRHSIYKELMLMGKFEEDKKVYTVQYLAPANASPGDIVKLCAILFRDSRAGGDYSQFALVHARPKLVLK